jgi:hypothetical protein
MGLPATQWISVYNAHRPMKQRYHYNVANNRVDQHGAFLVSVVVVVAAEALFWFLVVTVCKWKC